MLKICAKCKIEKSDSEFYVDKRRSDGLSSYCKQCRREVEKIRRDADPEEYKRYLKEYRDRNGDKYEIWKRTRRSKYVPGPKVTRKPKRVLSPDEIEAKKERDREKARRYYQEHREERLEYAKQYAEENHTERSEYRRQYNHDYPEQANQYRATGERNRRARLANAEGSHTSKDIQHIYDEQDGKCKYCGSDLIEYHIDHIVPLSRGGSNSRDNIALACPSCNMSKSNKLWPDEWTI